MKPIAIVTILALAAAAAAQPAPAPSPPPATPADQAGSGSGSDQPSWLPGVQDVTAAEMATPGKVTLSMARAVELAIKQHPNVRFARAQADAAYGRVDQARVAEHPIVTLTATAGASNQGAQFVQGPTGAGVASGGGYFTAQENTALSAGATWRIYDFGQTRANVDAAQANAEAQMASIGTTTLDTQQAVELAYLSCVAAHRLVIVAQATVKSGEAHYDQAKRFVAAQAHDPIEVAQALAALANAKSALAQAESNEATDLANLRAAIGLVDPTRAPAIDPNWPVPVEQDPPALPDLVNEAKQHRPEIVALDKQVTASDFSLTAAHAERRPTLSASAQTSWAPSSANWNPNPVWSANVSLAWKLWDGGQSAADVHVAHANLEAAAAQRDELLVTLTSALESARALIVSNKANVQSSTEAVTAAQAQLKLSEARYAQGLGSQIELADAQTAVVTAEGNLVTAELQLADGWANLKRAIGAM